jgi:hypothetical protein
MKNKLQRQRMVRVIRTLVSSLKEPVSHILVEKFFAQNINQVRRSQSVRKMEEEKRNSLKWHCNYESSQCLEKERVQGMAMEQDDPHPQRDYLRPPLPKIQRKDFREIFTTNPLKSFCESPLFHSPHCSLRIFPTLPLAKSFLITLSSVVPIHNILVSTLLSSIVSV